MQNDKVYDIAATSPRGASASLDQCGTRDQDLPEAAAALDSVEQKQQQEAILASGRPTVLGVSKEIGGKACIKILLGAASAMMRILQQHDGDIWFHQKLCLG